MVLDSAADKQNGTDWSKFEDWADSRLSVDRLLITMVHFDRDSITDCRIAWNDSSNVCKHLSVPLLL